MDALDIRNIAEEAIREHERKYHTGEPGELTPTGTHEKLMFGVSAENSETPPAPAPAKPMFRPRQWVIEKGPVLYKTTPWQIGRASAIRSVNGNHSYLKDNGVWWDESDLRLAKPSDFREKIGEVEMWAETNKNGSVSIFMDGRLTGRYTSLRSYR